MSYLKDSLAAHWFGTNDDADDNHTGGIDWTENGTITYGAGSPGRAVTVGGGSDNLSIANANLGAVKDMTGGWTFVARMEANTYPVSFNSIFSMGGDNASTDGIVITHRNDDKFLVRVSDGTNFEQDAATVATAALNTEYFICVRVNSSQISIIIDDNAEETTTLSSVVLANISITADAKIGSGFQNNGDFTISSMAVYDRYIDDEEVRMHRNGTVGVTFESELERDDWVNDSDVWRVKVQAKAAQIGGSSTQDAPWLVISEGALPDEMIDSDESSSISSGATVRASLDAAGTKQIPIKAIVTTPNATPASAKFEYHVRPYSWHTGDDTLDGTSGTDVYIWWDKSGATENPAEGPYGQYTVYEDATTFNGIYGDTTDYSNQGQTVTEAGSIATVAGPYGADGYEFDGTDDRILISDDPEIGFNATSFTVECMLYLDSLDTGGNYKTFFAKRLGTTTVNYGAGMNSDESGSDYVYSYFYDGGYERLDVDQSTNYSAATWFHFLCTWDTDGTDTDQDQRVDGVSVGTSSSSNKTPQDNNKDIVLGAVQDSVGVFSEFMDGRMKGFVVRSGIYTTDQRTTLGNNRSDPATFWDHSFAAEQPGNSTLSFTGVLTDEGETLSGSASVIVDITGALTDGGEALSGAVSVVVDVSGSIADAGEAVAGVVSTSQAFSGSLIDGSETLSGVASVIVDALGALTDGGEVLSGTVSVVVTASGSVADAGETLSGAMSDPNLVIVAKNPFVVPFEDRIFKVYA